MKERFNKISGNIFDIGIFILLCGGAIAFLVYIFAFFLGRENASALTEWVMNDYFPILFAGNIILCVIGLVNVYINGAKTFRFEVKKKKDNGE